MASSLEQLPAELLDRILCHVDIELPEKGVYFERERPRLQETRRLSLVSKTFQKATGPLLYRTVDFLHGNHARRLLRTLSTKPYLARYIKEAPFQGHVCETEGPPSERELTAYSTMLESAGSQDVRNEVWTGLKRGCHTAETILITALATTLQTLYFSLYHSSGSSGNHADRSGASKGCPHTTRCLDKIIAMSDDHDSKRDNNLRKVQLAGIRE
ncbi:hypothetical protein CLAFUW4_06214 [Fulvia fulva]|uniref:F-box domain-containing protein n=1 Tax=Passalora fulva TaxID=5499 RepID=A0A9Q8LIB4_PASFU|nr:uncharacterized protein CLAFUR5_06358 [Fulvia fulva]KAK4623963.1 hypothetical protein CLAFUR4_06217 [Fulvia fulva]KAK4625379.1 hypothetical protein CLAFUR0_06221 [Fulvia fulva]UJO17937.1 hypothetical protein CLAFUR5_06358 [Fulvia fulva]WPV14493.1 hypothetical protein CLAFUW4_06214 [Fulvia fulva]WPV30026.1 hypothetical protein CLAFUW7_06210 [Fulvia fulva]